MNITLNNISKQELISILASCNVNTEKSINNLFDNNTLVISNNSKFIYFLNDADAKQIYCIDISQYDNALDFSIEGLSQIDIYKRYLFSQLLHLADLDQEDSIEFVNIYNKIKTLINVNDIVIDPNSNQYEIIDNSLYDKKTNQIVLLTKKSNIDVNINSYSQYAFSMTQCCNASYSFNDNDYKFYTCNHGITDIHISSDIKKIQNFSFGNCVNLSSVEFDCPNITDIGIAAFNDAKLQSINIPNSVSCIDVCAFESNEKLAQLAIPKNVKLIRRIAFANNYQLSSIDVFSNSISIDIDAFYNNKSLQFVTFKERMANSFALNYDAFSGCNNLRYIVFEKGITFEQFKQSITNYILTYKIAIPTTNYIDISSCLENAIQYDFFNDNYIQLSDMN